MKTIGILGGMGSYATALFFQRILEAAEARRDDQNPRLVIDNNPRIPSRYLAVTAGGPSPVPAMVEGLNGLAGLGAELLAVPCNAAHHFYPEVAPRLAAPWVSMVEAVAARVSARYRHPLVLGAYVTVSRGLYSGLRLSAEGEAAVDAVIDSVKIGASLDQSLLRLGQSVRDGCAGADCVLLACTELTAIPNPEKLFGLPVVDSSRVYAEALVYRAKEEAA